MQKAEIVLARAQLKYASLGAPTDTERKLSSLTVSQTKFAMDAAEREWQRFKTLGESGIESGRTVALARLKYERARADHLKAATDHKLLMKGDPQEDIDVAFQQVERAKTALRLAGERLTGETAYQATQVQVAKVAVDRVKALIALQQGRIDRSHVSAPVTGVVYYPRYWGMPLREGDPVWQGNRFMDIAVGADMTVESVVNQIDWPRVKVAQKVELRMVAYPGSLYHGVVSEVGVLARDRSLILREKPANVMSFRVLVDVTEKSPELRSSYTVRTSIITHRFSDRIAVPRRALVRRASRPDGSSGSGGKGGHAVWVMQNGSPVLREVTLGPADATQVVVEEGLELGEEILLPRKGDPEEP